MGHDGDWVAWFSQGLPRWRVEKSVFYLFSVLLVSTIQWIGEDTRKGILEYPFSPTRFRARFRSNRRPMEPVGGGIHTRGSPLREYYLALGSINASLETLTELILALAPEAQDASARGTATGTAVASTSTTLSVSVVVCVSSRDVLDDVVCGLRGNRAGRRRVGINMWILHSDMLEREVTSYANEFREVARCAVARSDVDPDVNPDVDRGVDEDVGAQGGAAAPVRSIVNVLVTTDSPLKTLGKLNSDPLVPTLLIHYSLPRRREEYLRRTSVVLGSRKSGGGSGGHARVAVCFVHAGRLDELHAFESMADRSLLEMPVHVRDIFGEP